MKSYGSATTTYLAGRYGIVSRVLFWVSPRDFGAPTVKYPVGFWTGAQDMDFTIDSVVRTYHGAGTILQPEPITTSIGLNVRRHELPVIPLSDEMVDIFRTYELRLAPLEIHRALFYPADMTLVEEPHRLFKGYVDEVVLPTPEIGGEATARITIASTARNLTKTVPQKRSDVVQQMRGGDRFRRYTDISGAVDVWWGEKKHRPSEGGFGGLTGGLVDLV